MSHSCLVLIANGSEEIETISVVDTLRRAAIDVTLASVSDNVQVECSRGVNIVADMKLSDCNPDNFECIVLPGGLKGAEAFRDCAMVKEIVSNFIKSDKLVAAICAAPAVVLGTHGFLDGRKATSYPAFWDKLPNCVKERVVVDGNLITSQGPATAIEFAGAIIEKLCGSEKSSEVLSAMLAI